MVAELLNFSFEIIYVTINARDLICNSFNAHSSPQLTFHSVLYIIIDDKVKLVQLQDRVYVTAYFPKHECYFTIG